MVVPAVCLRRPYVKELEEGVRLLPTTQGICRHKRVLHYVLPVLPFDGARFCASFEGCARNDMYALRERHLTKTPLKEADKVGAYMKYFCDKLPKTVVYPWTPEKVLAHRSSRLKRRYAEAFKSLRENPLTPRDARVEMFVKFEKEWADEITEKTPRAIQFRSPRYTASISQYLMPVEKKIFSLDKNGVECDVEQRLFAKGLNSFQRARRLQAMHKWKNTVWILLDHSRFDANVTEDHIRWESKIYRRVLAGPTEQLDDLMRMQLSNRGRTKSGLRYVCRGKKMSGEYNTSLGDSVINAALLLYWLRECSTAEIFVDGDDSVIAVSEEDYTKLDLGYFAANGWTTKVEITREFNRVEFCQCRPVEVQPGNWRMVRNPWRVMNRSICTIQRYHGKAWQGYLRAVADCEYYCGFGVPVLEAFAHYMRRHSEGQKPVSITDQLLYRAKIEPHITYRRNVITSLARTSLALTWGISEAEQLALESYFNSANDLPHVHRLVAGPVGRSVCDAGDTHAYDILLRQG